MGLRRMDVEKRPKYLPRIQVGSFIMVLAEKKDIDIIEGSCGGRTMSAHEPLGKPVRPSTTACCPDFTDAERHC